MGLIIYPFKNAHTVNVYLASDPKSFFFWKPFLIRIEVNQLEKLEAAKSAYLWLPLVTGFDWA